jgi:hypothetical protein
MNNASITPQKHSTSWIRVTGGVLLLVLAMALTGCYGGAVKEEIWLKSNDRWEAELTFTLTAEEREALDAEMGEGGFEEYIESVSSEDDSLKIHEREEPDGGISYVIKASGRDLSSLNNDCFDGSATIRKNDEGHLYIAWTPSSDYTYMLREMTIVIHANEILSSNANTMEDTTATWRDPSYVEVQADVSGFPFAKVMVIGMGILFVLGLTVLGGVGFFVLLRRQRSKEEGA